MIVPAVTTVPLETLTPRRWAFESRPLREDAAPFFFDMAQPFVIAVISIVVYF